MTVSTDREISEGDSGEDFEAWARFARDLQFGRYNDPGAPGEVCMNLFPECH